MIIHKMYLCNKKRCGEGHDCGECHLTSDVEYSKNGDFEYHFLYDRLIAPKNIEVITNDEDVFLIEKEGDEDATE